MTQLGEAFVPIRATLDKLDADLAGAKSKIQGALSGLQSIGGAAIKLGIAGVTAAVVGLGAGLGLAVSEAMSAQAVMAQTTAVIRSTGGAAGLTADQVADLATALSLESRFSDDAIQSAENLLLTFTNIGEETFPGATQALVDMATAMGTDVSSSAIQLGKALNDPVAGISALTRVGVTFSDEQKKVIEQLVATGDVAGAQAVILAELNKEFGGSAAEAASTFAGKMDVLKNRLLNVAEAVGLQLLPFLTTLLDTVIAPAIPVVEAIATQFGVFFDRLAAGFTVAQALPALFQEIGLAMGLSQEQAFELGQKVGDVITWFTDLIAKVQETIAAVQPYIETAAAWLAANVSLQDVLIALGIAIAAVVIPAIVSVVAAAAPIVLLFVGIIAVAALLRKAWEENWGGIQEKTAAVWAQVEPVFNTVKEWLAVNIPVALAALQSFWVDVAWPAIQNAVAVAWPVIQSLLQALGEFITGTVMPTVANLWTQWTTVWWPGIQSALASAWAFIEPILAAVGEFITGTLIPTVVELYTKWTTVWWPEIQNTLSNVWEVISEVFAELGRWINDNIVPWVQFLGEQWGEIFDAIGTKLTEVWGVLKPIWEDLKLWLDTNIPVALNALSPIFAGVMTAILGAVQPVKDLWDGLVAAIQGFWTWITSHTFNFSINLPDLPDWAVPGSPLPIHTAWKAFAEEMDSLTIAPRVELGELAPVAALVEDGGPDRNVSFNSQTSVYTSQDPMRVLRASRHLDKMGSIV